MAGRKPTPPELRQRHIHCTLPAPAVEKMLELMNDAGLSQGGAITHALMNSKAARIICKGSNELKRHLEAQIRYITANRERLAMAFMAESGLKPKDCVMVENRKADGTVEISFRRKDDE